jgi:hypothetical protein
MPRSRSTNWALGCVKLFFIMIVIEMLVVKGSNGWCGDRWESKKSRGIKWRFQIQDIGLGSMSNIQRHIVGN